METVYKNIPKFIKKYPADKQDVLHKVKNMEKPESSKEIQKQKAEKRLSILESINYKA
jgi:hypothetical protein